MSSPDLLVTGAGGHLGRRVLHHLVDTLGVPPGRIAAGSRKPSALAEWAERGVIVRSVDFHDPASLPAAFAGITRLLVISTDSIGQRLQPQLAAIAAAERAGVRHVLYTSMPKPEGSPLLFAPEHLRTEEALAASRLPEWTVLRNNWYFENLLAALPPALASGRLYTAAGDGRIAHIARDDLARAAAAALAGATAGKTTLTLGGNRAYSTREIAALVAAATGRPLEVIDAPLEGIVAGMMAAGLPETVARIFASADLHIAAGGLDTVTGDYRRLTGTAPLPFEDWLAAHRSHLAAMAA